MNIGAAKSFWCLCIVGWAVFTDIRRHKIKNYTVVAGIVGGLTLNIADIKSALIGLAVPLVLIVLFAVNMMGAGDIKLLCAVGAIMCFPDIIKIILFSFIFCGVHILVRAIRQHGVRDMFSDIWSDFRFFVLTRKINKEFAASKRLPMAGSISAATLLMILERAFKMQFGGG